MHLSLQSFLVRRLPDASDSKVRSWIPRTLELKVTVLARTSINLAVNATLEVFKWIYCRKFDNLTDLELELDSWSVILNDGINSEIFIVQNSSPDWKWLDQIKGLEIKMCLIHYATWKIVI